MSEEKEIEQLERERKNKVKILLRDIKLGKEKKMIQAVQALKVHGDDRVILPVIDAWNKGVSPVAEAEIIAFLEDIKSSSAAQIFMDILMDDEYEKIRLPLLSIVWNQKVDYSEFLVDFINMAINNGFMEALECITIIENLEGPLEERQILDAEIIIREYADRQSQHQTDDDGKLNLIAEISKVIDSFERGLA